MNPVLEDNAKCESCVLPQQMKTTETMGKNDITQSGVSESEEFLGRSTEEKNINLSIVGYNDFKNGQSSGTMENEIKGNSVTIDKKTGNCIEHGLKEKTKGKQKMTHKSLVPRLKRCTGIKTTRNEMKRAILKKKKKKIVLRVRFYFVF